ncbi:MAG: HEAT repeat domain-containing protein [Planctomycetia bacterium]|nr:HEAT repeat domain-containing protein [Planctomycetia bacterium]
MKPAFATPLVALVAVFLSCDRARADVFVLNNGGRVEGTLANPDEKPRDKYVIKTSTGGEITLRRDQVKEFHPTRPEEQEYEQIRPKYPDTVDGHFELAEWCREHKLLAQRKRHLERVIELEPDHAKARAMLGFSKVAGEWKTQDQVRRDRGYVQDKNGRWYLPQQIEENERQKKQKQAESEWYAKIKRWREWLNDQRSADAEALIQKIDDPNAVAALKHGLQREAVPEVRKLYVEALARTGAPDAWRVLTKLSLEDPVDEIRMTCLDYLEKQPNTGAVDVYIKGLKHKNNAMVNRAALGLARMKDPRALRPLIDALVTTHTFIIDPGTAGNISSTFNSAGGGTFSFGGGGQKSEDRPVQNATVRDALVSMAGGANFDYDVRAWKNWFAARKKAEMKNVDVRRD